MEHIACFISEYKRKASKDLGAWFAELQAEVFPSGYSCRCFIHLVCDPLPIAQPPKPLFPPEFHEAQKEFYDNFHTMKTNLEKEIMSDESLREVYERFLFFFYHCDRHTNLLAFIRCSKKN